MRCSERNPLLSRSPPAVALLVTNRKWLLSINIYIMCRPITAPSYHQSCAWPYCDSFIHIQMKLDRGRSPMHDLGVVDERMHHTSCRGVKHRRSGLLPQKNEPSSALLAVDEIRTDVLCRSFGNGLDHHRVLRSRQPRRKCSSHAAHTLVEAARRGERQTHINCVFIKENSNACSRCTGAACPPL